MRQPVPGFNEEISFLSCFVAGYYMLVTLRYKGRRREAHEFDMILHIRYIQFDTQS